MTNSRFGSRSSQAKALREKTWASASATYGRRNSHAERAAVVRHVEADVTAPDGVSAAHRARRAPALRSAGRGGGQGPLGARDARGRGRSRRRRARRSLAPRPRADRRRPAAPCRRLWSRFVSAKKSGFPAMTFQRQSKPAPRTYATSDCSSSATPPPRAVELTFQMARAPIMPRARSIVARRSEYCASVSTALNRASGCAAIGTSSRSVSSRGRRATADGASGPGTRPRRAGGRCPSLLRSPRPTPRSTRC